MKSGRWQKIKELYEAALMLPSDERASFLDERCDGDDELRREIESLLSFSSDAGSFLESPAVGEVAEIVVSKNEKLVNGKQIGHYEIISEIGAGGMGEVFLARDDRLNRKVALKLLASHITEDAARVSRFRQEAFATSALNHPNIVTIYEIGKWQDRDFIAAEFVDGMTLRSLLQKKKLSIGEALNIALQIASALAAAHGAGIVHRDIKPENIVIRPDNLVKVLDFGIAKYRPTEKGQKALVETEVGEVIGTAAYMSPEQARGLEVDSQTDVWSLGVILYEMLAGRLPFAGETKSDRIAAVLEHDPAPLTKTNGKVSPQLQQIVERALAKDKKERYASVADMAEDLYNLRETTGDKSHSPFILPARKPIAFERRRLFAAAAMIVFFVGAIGFWFYFSDSGKTAVGETKSIAVLPLKPINQANRDELYEVGIADTLIHQLSSLKGFVVRPLSATRKYADVEQDPLAAGREQQVDYVLASNYQIAGERIRITAQLINVETGQTEDTYKSEKDAGDVFAMQDQIAGEVGNRLLARFATTAGSPIEKRGTANEEAYRLYLQGMFLANKKTYTNAQKAIEILERAVELDPNYAQAWAGKAYAHNFITGATPYKFSNQEEYQKSTDAINKALSLDANLAEAHTALCEIKLYYEYDFTGAEAACRRAIEINPNLSLARLVYSQFLMSRGRFDEAIAEIKQAIDLEPASLLNQNFYGISFYYARRYPEAVAQFKRVLAMDENYSNATVWLTVTLAAQGNESEAFESYLKEMIYYRVEEELVKADGETFQTSGWRGVMRKRAERFEQDNFSYFHGASFNIQAGNTDKAFEYLEKSYQRREVWMSFLKVDPRLDPLRGDPRFDELVKRVESN